MPMVLMSGWIAADALDPKIAPRENSGHACPEISQPLLRFFGRYAEGYLRRHFHAVRLLRGRSRLTTAEQRSW